MRYVCLALIDARVVAQVNSARVEHVNIMSRRNATASAPATTAPTMDDIDDAIEFLNEGEVETEAEVTVPSLDSAQAFSALRNIVNESPRKSAASAIFEGRYKSGVFSPEGRELLYPYLGARKIYPQGCVGIRAKLDYVASLLPSPEPITNLLPVDLARLALAAGIELPTHLQPEPLKAALMGARSSAASSDDWS